MSKGESKKRSIRQERRVASETGTSVVPASGAMPSMKSDTRLPGTLRLECKSTLKKSFPLTSRDVEKIQLEALGGGLEEWAMQIEMRRANGAPLRLAVLGWHDYLALRAKSEGK